MQNPLVSIVVPSYNHAKYITQCIESIVSQDCDNFELIVIDDGSSDESPHILTELKKKYNFKLIFQENQGSSKTLNRGFKEIAKGKYLTFCSSDDYWLPGKLRKQVEFLEQNNEYAMVFGKSLIINELEKIELERTENSNRNLKGGWIFNELINIKFHPPGNSMLREESVRKLGYYRENIWAEDFDMVLRVSYNYPIGFIDEYLSVYRIDNSIPSKILNFKTINSHWDSIYQFKDTEYYSEAIRNWNFRCFTWYAPYIKGKLFATRGMLKSLNKLNTKEFLISFLVLIFKWHKE